MIDQKQRSPPKAQILEGKKKKLKSKAQNLAQNNKIMIFFSKKKKSVLIIQKTSFCFMFGGGISITSGSIK